MKLIDCFMYFDEDLILDIRLNVLYDSVDKFIIAEATRDHAGKEKKLNFDLNNFSKFKKKIEYLIIDDLPIKVTSKKNDWHENHLRDQFQRNSLERGYKSFKDEDLIMISDIDGYDSLSLFSSPQPLMSPSWSPDMQNIAYVSYLLFLQVE